MLDPNFNPVIRVRGLQNRFGTQVVHDRLDMEVHNAVARQHQDGNQPNERILRGDE